MIASTIHWKKILLPCILPVILFRTFFHLPTKQKIVKWLLKGFLRRAISMNEKIIELLHEIKRNRRVFEFCAKFFTYQIKRER